MTPKIKLLLSIDMHEEIDRHTPPDPSAFLYSVMADIGPDDQLGADQFEFVVTTPTYLLRHFPADGYLWGRHYLLLPRWDVAAIRRALDEALAQAAGPDWATVAGRIARFAHWEFEDYRP